MKLTIKSIIRWEQLRKKPFTQMNYENVKDITALFYCCYLNEGKHISLEEFSKTKGRTMADVDNMIAEFARQTVIDAQFQEKQPKEKSSKKQEGKEGFIKDVIAMLIMDGLDAHYAMNEMELHDVPMFIKAYEARMKSRLESERLWTYIQVSPHLSRSINSPKDIYPFSWEIEEQESSREAELEKGISVFEAFMNSKPKAN